jgi:large subunit ribosomal protein L29
MAKKLSYQELKKMSENDLKSKLVDTRTDLLRLNAQRATGTAVENPGRISQLRKLVARIKTLFNEKGGLKTK